MNRPTTALMACLVAVHFLITPAARPAEDMSAAGRADTYYKDALAAHQADKNNEAIALLRQALALRPNKPYLLSALAQVQSLAGLADGSMATLAQMARLGLFLDLDARASFEPLRRDPRYGAMVARFRANLEPVGQSAPALQLAEKVRLIEGVAFDARTGTFYLSSIVERRILAVSYSGQVRDFVPAGKYGLPSPMGLKIDTVTETLWASATPAIEFALKLDTDEPVAPQLFAFDLATGDMKRSIKPDDGLPHIFGDFAFAADGTVYLSDSEQPAIYRIRPASDTLERFATHAEFRSLQGITFSADGKTLFIADYSSGLFAVDPATGEVRSLKPSADVVPYHVDGLYTYGDSLIAIQNGTNPQRVARFTVDLDKGLVDSMAILDANHPAHFEPTLGQIVGDDLLYVANSGWPLFGGDAAPADADLPQTTVLRLKLK